MRSGAILDSKNGRRRISLIGSGSYTVNGDKRYANPKSGAFNCLLRFVFFWFVSFLSVFDSLRHVFHEMIRGGDIELWYIQVYCGFSATALLYGVDLTSYFRSFVFVLEQHFQL